ncbi:hypothetical protein CQW23_05538 [Capsicum baccatum]|uniref:Disease resistance N-terminal domain-containing protein n=1 Tax=Capsicum baccatum TaxID=33114 RepID=A0A2G2XHT2_CAPBA|nr:hypothetical protein CQW23_05538 [Capsicum baccatum]
MADAIVKFLLLNLKQLLLYHVDLLSGVKGQVESLHRELSLMKAFLKVSREKRTSVRIIQQEKQEGDVKDNVFKLVIYPPDI